MVGQMNFHGAIVERARVGRVRSGPPCVRAHLINLASSSASSAVCWSSPPPSSASHQSEQLPLKSRQRQKKKKNPLLCSVKATGKKKAQRTTDSWRRGEGAAASRSHVRTPDFAAAGVRKRPSSLRGSERVGSKGCHELRERRHSLFGRFVEGKDGKKERKERKKERRK